MPTATMLFAHLAAIDARKNVVAAPRASLRELTLRACS